jgi:hypothetical protein
VVKVGLIADFTGAFATWGAQFQQAIEAYQALNGKTVKGPDDGKLVNIDIGQVEMVKDQWKIDNPPKSN